MALFTLQGPKEKLSDILYFSLLWNFCEFAKMSFLCSIRVIASNRGKQFSLRNSTLNFASSILVFSD